LSFSAKTDEVLKAKVAKREEEARKKLEDGKRLLLYECGSDMCPICKHWHKNNPIHNVGKKGFNSNIC